MYRLLLQFDDSLIEYNIFIGQVFWLTVNLFFLKGLDHARTGLNLVSNMIKESLGISDISVLMGANLAKEVAREMFGEATIGKITK